LKFEIGLILFLLLFFLYGSVAFGVYHPILKQPQGVEGGKIKVLGVDLRYHQVGEGEDVLLMHGCPGMIEDWDELIPYLTAKHCRVTVYDRPGFGYSDGRDIRYSLDNNVETAFRLIDQLELKKPVILVGHSYGTGMALKMALEKPEEVRKLVLIGAVPYQAGVPISARFVANPVVGPAIAALESFVFRSRSVQGAVADLFVHDPVPQGFFEPWKIPYSRPWPKLAMCRELVRNDAELEAMAPRYPSIKIPMTIVEGSDDPFFAVAKRLHEAVPASEFVVFEGHGHYVHVVEPQKVADFIR